MLVEANIKSIPRKDIKMLLHKQLISIGQQRDI